MANQFRATLTRQTPTRRERYLGVPRVWLARLVYVVAAWLEPTPL